MKCVWVGGCGEHMSSTSKMSGVDQGMSPVKPFHTSLWLTAIQMTWLPIPANFIERWAHPGLVVIQSHSPSPLDFLLLSVTSLCWPSAKWSTQRDTWAAEQSSIARCSQMIWLCGSVYKASSCCGWFWPCLKVQGRLRLQKLRTQWSKGVTLRPGVLFHSCCEFTQRSPTDIKFWYIRSLIIVLIWHQCTMQYSYALVHKHGVKSIPFFHQY